MSYRRSLIHLFALCIGTLWLTACAATQNTPAQALAWERWSACDHFATIRLDRIDLDGRIVATGAEYEVPAFTGCVRQVAAEQIQKGLAPPSAAALVTTIEGQKGRK